jgi:ATP-dependent exoDNAse (exonuclease V) beta subunit
LATNFDIYNASAGSGKTFTLTSRVLTSIIKSKEEDSFKSILALTFTNKAAEEMKHRILTGLKEFSDFKNTTNPSALFKKVLEETELSPKKICEISKKRLSILLHNFSFFQILTLDSFNHNIIRAFSKELNLASNFSVIIDSEEFINEAVERLLAQIGKDKKTSNALIDFANKKINEGKSWDISFDLRELAKTLTNESHYNKVKILGEKSLEDFLIQKKKINERIFKIEKTKTELVKQMELSVNSAQIELVFSRNSFPNFLTKLKSDRYSLVDINSISNLFEKRTIITKKSLKDSPELGGQLIKSLNELFVKTKELLLEKMVLKSFSLAIIPAAVLSLIKKNSKEIQKEKGELLLSEFNQRISEEIKDHPAPYIYEKIGTKFKDYMIDEFQDTSLLQWSNLIPLISHALESEDISGKKGSLLLVGDPKQSVYRWRAANPDIFISLILKANPFSVLKSNKMLPKNYRSNKEIIEFNNSFFQHLSQIMENPVNKQIYQAGTKQEISKTKEGHVSLEFLKNKNDEEYLEKTFQKIKSCKSRGYSYLDFGILVRTKKQAAALASYLISKKIPVISSETLLLNSSNKVKFLIELIRFRTDPSNQFSRKTIINFLIQKENPKDECLYFEQLIKESPENIFKKLGIMSFQDFLKIPFIKAIEIAVLSLNLDEKNDGFIHFLKEELFEFVLKNGIDETEFLDYWEKNKDKRSIVMGGNQEAVTILTIHKAKGLEFPVVIYPFADSATFRSFSEKTWLPVSDKKNSIELLIPFTKAIQAYGESGKKIFNERRDQQELDNTNILYVALTRAVEELHIISKYPKKKSINSHNEMFRSFLESERFWEEDKLVYFWGKESNKQPKTPLFEEKTSVKYQKQAYKSKGKREFQDEHILFGKTFHEIMSKIQYSYQLEREIADFRKSKNIKGINKEEIIRLVEQLLIHPDLKQLFDAKNTVICEKEIFVNENKIIRPDRIVIKGIKNCTIVDYKTGNKRAKDFKQALDYSDVLRKMGYTIEKTLIVYFKPQIDVVDVK